MASRRRRENKRIKPAYPYRCFCCRRLLILSATSSACEIDTSSEISNQVSVNVNDGAISTVVLGDRNVVHVHCKCFVGAATEKMQNAKEARKTRNIRKRTKRQRSSSKYTTSSSDDDTTDPTLSFLSFESDGPSFEQALQTLHSCVNPLHPLLYDGKWAEFESRAQELSHQADGDQARQIFILLERSVALSLTRGVEESEDMIHGAVKKIGETSGCVRLLLEVLSKTYLSVLYRRRKMLGKAHRHLRVAKKIASAFPTVCLPVAFLLYEEGSLYKEIASMLLGSEDASTAEARKLFQKCIDTCFCLDLNQIYVRKQHFAVCKLASINFHCETNLSRSKTVVSPKMIEEGRQRLETLKSEHYSRQETRGTKIQRLIGEVDLCFRLEKFLECQNIANEALAMAKRLGYHLDAKRLQARLADIGRKTTESANSETFRTVPAGTDSSSLCSDSSNDNSACSLDSDDKFLAISYGDRFS